MVSIRTSYEKERGCGFRKPGGIYLVSEGEARGCGKMPLPFERCPTCDAGVKPTRGWTMLDLRPFVADRPCIDETAWTGETPTDQQGAERRLGLDPCGGCPLSGSAEALGERVGLLWIGTKFYPTPADFLRETAEQGVSRRLPAVPKELVVGETWVLMAHRKGLSKICDECGGQGDDADDRPEPAFGGPTDEPAACEGCDGEGRVWIPAGVHLFRPTAIEYVVKGDETEEQLEHLEKRGLSLVRVVELGEDEEVPAAAELRLVEDEEPPANPGECPECGSPNIEGDDPEPGLGTCRDCGAEVPGATIDQPTPAPVEREDLEDDEEDERAAGSAPRPYPETFA